MALQLYRRILRAARQFDPETRKAVQSEASALFRQNASLNDPDLIAAKLFEGTTRLELAQHYGIAAPRLYNVMPNTIPAGKHDKLRRKSQPVPAYMDSYYVHKDDRK